MLVKIVKCAKSVLNVSRPFALAMQNSADTRQQTTRRLSHHTSDMYDFDL